MPAYFGWIGQAAPAIAMLAVFALLWGAMRVFRQDRRKALLMLGAAIVVFANVLLWVL